MKSNIGRSHNALTTELNFEVCAVFVKHDRQHDFSDDSNLVVALIFHTDYPTHVTREMLNRSFGEQ